MSLFDTIGDVLKENTDLAVTATIGLTAAASGFKGEHLKTVMGVAGLIVTAFAIVEFAEIVHMRTRGAVNGTDQQST